MKTWAGAGVLFGASLAVPVSADELALAGASRGANSDYAFVGTVLPVFHGLRELGLVLLPALLAIDAFERAILGHLHEPGARLAWDAVLRPCLERSDQRVLGELLGRAQIATDEPSEPGNQPCPLDAKDRFDSALGFVHVVVSGAASALAVLLLGLRAVLGVVLA